ncbi:hypothetical protein B7492_11820 [Bacillus mycoides]|uniref:Uncharacterized protein n=1 Tax=Bacillus mycoides TaxID=1405 RepID=A0A1W6A7Y7_BACMY|nr:hypothetical protein B7492_11820 [Bacillus mycoides]
MYRKEQLMKVLFERVIINAYSITIICLFNQMVKSLAKKLHSCTTKQLVNKTNCLLYKRNATLTEIVRNLELQK